MFKPLDKEIVLIFLLSLIVFASGADLVADSSHGASVGHIAKEAMIVTLSILAIIWLIAGLRQKSRDIERLQQEISEISHSSITPKKYIIDARKTLGGVINQQFTEWELTDSEADVGRFLLKGLSLKEISVLRKTLEKTVRQQASSIYGKANLSGRHSLSAWFIEDIL